MNPENRKLTLPALDLSQFMHGNAQDKAQFATDFCNSLKSHGFAKLVNHGLSDEAVKGLYHWVSFTRQTCELPSSRFRGLRHPRTGSSLTFRPHPKPRSGTLEDQSRSGDGVALVRRIVPSFTRGMSGEAKVSTMTPLPRTPSYPTRG